MACALRMGECSGLPCKTANYQPWLWSHAIKHDAPAHLCSLLPSPWCSRQSGYGRYGPPPGMIRGARVIELKQGESAVESDTWIRLVSGTLLCLAVQQPHSHLLGCPAVLQPHSYLLDCGWMCAPPGVFHLASCLWVCL